jgi:hypothetical protein
MLINGVFERRQDQGTGKTAEECITTEHEASSIQCLSSVEMEVPAVSEAKTLKPVV